VSLLVARATMSPPAMDLHLRLAVEQALDGHTGGLRRILSVERVPSPYRASCALEQLRVRFEGRDPLDIIFKDLGPEALSEEARQIKPQFLHDPRREIEVYRDLLSIAPLGTPLCYGSVVDDRAGRYWLFLERVAGRELYQIGDLDTWRDVAHWLALFHTTFTGLAPVAGASDVRQLLRHDEAYYRLWCERALVFLRQGGGDRTDAGRHVIEWLSAAYDSVIECLLALPSTLIHDFLEALDCCRVQVALQWLGWASNWTPPLEHRHDWLGDILQVSARLRL
jgi:hypothetical protein